MTFLHPQRDGAARHLVTTGFTLVELMVTMVILAMLAALTLSGLSGVRDRVKADKTRSTIRKIHEVIVPHYESYLARRVPQGASATAVVWDKDKGQFVHRIPPDTVTSSTVPAASRLWGLRLLMTLEMPDQWSDVAPPDVRIPGWMVTTPVKRFAAVKSSSGTTPPSPAYESAECLALTLMRGGFDADVMESFRADEIGDVDEDRHPEFLDGWGKPIGFIRWPTGFDSPLQLKDASVNPDPFDPMRRSQTIYFPIATTGTQPDYGVTPLIFSSGADAAMDVPVTGANATTPAYGGYYAAVDIDPNASWVTKLTNLDAVTLLTSGTVPSTRAIRSGTATAPGAVQDFALTRDNITNFDLMKK